jgi:hypothetical protein
VTTVQNVSCASLPEESLTALAALRNQPDITVALMHGRAWVRWPAGDEVVLRAVLPVAGVQLYVQHAEHWHRYGRHLPAFDLPMDARYRPLHQLLTPAPIRPLPPPANHHKPVAVKLVADVRPRPATALRCSSRDLQRWADKVPSCRLERIQAACCDGRLLLVGSSLPALGGGERFWGETMLIPLGQRPDPELPAAAIREALGIADDELLLLTAAGAEVIARSALCRLTRAQIRLAQEEIAS